MSTESSASDAHRVEPLLLNVDQVAALLAISPRAVWKYVSARLLPRPIRIGRCCRWHRHDLEDFLRGMRAPTPVA